MGLVPEAACEPGAAWIKQIPDFDPDLKILERRLEHPLSGPRHSCSNVHNSVELEHVNVVRGERMVLHDLSLEVGDGEQIALLGPNGCGKSTLLKTLTCELYPLAQPQTRVSIFGRERGT